MKANRLYGIHDLRFEEMDEPKLKDGEVLLKMKACGICGSDVNRYFTSGTYHYPTTIGHEFSGVVAKVRDHSEMELLDKRVGVFPLKPCFKCEQCKKGNYELCSNYDYLGSRCDGGFAEYVAVPKWNLIELPDSVSFEQGAMLEPAAVALHVIKKLSRIKGENVLITGPGTIGIIMAKIAMAKGAANVILIGRTEEKLKFAEENGVLHTLNFNEPELDNKLKEITGQRGIRIALEGTGSSTGVDFILKHIEAEGEVVLFGNPQGDIDISKDAYWKILRKQLVLKGSWNSSYMWGGMSEWHEILEMMQTGKLDISGLITQRLPLANLKDGLEMMNDKNCFTCKVMVKNDEP